MAAVATADGGDAKGFEYFVEIVNAFRDAAKSADGDDMSALKVDSFLNAMTMFLRIFDAFANPFFANVVKKDVQGNIKKLRAAAEKCKSETLGSVLESELTDKALSKLIKKESGAGAESGTVALLWMKRMMQFVTGMLQLLCDDSKVSLSDASRKSYAKTLSYCHSFITRGIFDNGLRFVPSRETFYKNLANGAPVEKVEEAIAEFITIFEPMLMGIDKMYKARELEPLIK